MSSAASVPDLIRTHEAAVSNDVGGKNSGQAAFHMGTHTISS